MILAAAVAGLAAAGPYLWLLERWAAWSLLPRLAGTALLYGGIGVAYLGTARLLGVRGLERC